MASRCSLQEFAGNLSNPAAWLAKVKGSTVRVPETRRRLSQLTFLNYAAKKHTHSGLERSAQHQKENNNNNKKKDQPRQLSVGLERFRECWRTYMWPAIEWLPPTDKINQAQVVKKKKRVRKTNKHDSFVGRLCHTHADICTHHTKYSQRRKKRKKKLGRSCHLLMYSATRDVSGSAKRWWEEFKSCCPPHPTRPYFCRMRPCISGGLLKPLQEKHLLIKRG